MNKGSVQERLMHMEHKLAMTIDVIKESQTAMKISHAKVMDEYARKMDYLLLPWWKRLVTRRPR